ncbi:MAG: hypothetical protein IPK53_11520 [bacterium]|nr:hypothetical protein [bacterium]
MATHRQSPNLFEVDPEAYQALHDAQWTYGSTTSQDIYELRLQLATPAATTAEKANAPVIGLLTLDGFLSYVAFRAALNKAIQTAPELSKRLIWQGNTALRNVNAWVDFQLPLQAVSLPNSFSLL